MSRYRDDLSHVDTALTIKRHGQSDKTLLELVREQRENDR